MISRGIEVEHWLKMGEAFCSFPQKQFKRVTLLNIIHTGGLSGHYNQRFDFNKELQLLQHDRKKSDKNYTPLLSVRGTGLSEDETTLWR